MMELIISGYRVDLYPFAGVGITYQTANIFQLDTRSGNFTNKFKVPKTANNNLVAGFVNSVNSDSNVPYQLNEARIIVDGIDVMPQGSAIIEESDDDYSISVFSGNYDFFNIIKNRNINELDFSSYNHLFEKTVIKGLMESVTSGVTYPIVDFYKDRYLNYINDIAGGNRRNVLRLGSMLPALYTKTIFEKITELTGYSFTGTFTSSTMWDKLLLSANRFTKTFTEETNKQERITSSNTFFSTSLSSGTIHDFPAVYYAFPFNQNTSLFSYTGDILTPHQTGNYEMNARLVFDLTAPIGRHTKFFFFYREVTSGGTLIGDVEFRSENNTVIFDNGFDASRSISLSTESIDKEVQGAYYFEAGKYYKPYLGYYVNTLNGSGSYATSLTMKQGCSIDFNPTATIYPHDTVDVSTCFDKSIYDFVKDIILMNGLNVQANLITKEIKLDYINDLRTNDYIDWTNKVDISKGLNIQFQVGNYAQTNYFKYSNNDEASTGSLLIANTLLEEEATAVQLRVPAVTETYTYLAPHTSPTVYTIPKVPILDYEIDELITQDSGGVAGFTFPTWEQVTDGDCYFLVSNNENIAANSHSIAYMGYGTGSGLTSLVSQLNFAFFSKSGDVNSLDFTNLLDLRYVAVREMFSKMKAVTLYFNLSPVDINNLNTSIPVFINIKDCSGYFYINKIENYKDKNSVKVQLIRL